MTGRVLKGLGTCGFVLAFAVGLHAQTRQIISTDRRNLGRVTYPATAVVTSNMIDGYVRVTGNGRFVFPVCDNSVYRPFAANMGGTTGAYFAVNPGVAITSSHKGGNYPPLPTGGPFSPASKDANVGKISATEYWDVNGTVATKLTFSWNVESGMSAFLPGGDLTKLYMVGWNGSRWVKLPGTVDAVSVWGGASTLTAGSITTNSTIVPNTYLVYTFGTELSAAREMAPLALAEVSADSTVALNAERSRLSADEVETAIYPNPVRDRFFIQAQAADKIRRIAVSDLTGRNVLVHAKPDGNGIDVAQLPAGMYVVSFEDHDGKTVSRKIIIAK
ncbi:MAG: T9SS type A sorting domain-containing protein [Dyadobacter fermentans]